jgi:hypothetical protein
MTDIIASDKASNNDMDRRMALRVLAAITASTQAPMTLASAEPALDLARQVGGPAGTLTDPDLRAGLVPWSRTLGSVELALLEKLCALILPADEHSPSAADLACHDFIDEWVSAPYPRQQRDRKIILAGLNWLDQQATEHNQAETFLQLETTQQTAILDSICTPATAINQAAAGFFSLLRALVCGAFFTTQAGMDDLQYIGNKPQASWSLPPKEVLDHLGLTGELGG